MKAIGKNLLILPIVEKDKVTEGGLMLHIKDREDLRYSKAKVIQTGLDVKGVKNDDIIFYDKHAGFKIELDNVEYRVITDSAIVIVL
jgi:co-chaperonin GroES (HSP10)